MDDNKVRTAIAEFLRARPQTDVAKLYAESEAEYLLAALTKAGFKVVPESDDSSEWKRNALYLLETTPGAVRAHPGGGAEVVMDSLIATYISLRDGDPLCRKAKVKKS